MLHSYARISSAFLRHYDMKKVTLIGIILTIILLSNLSTLSLSSLALLDFVTLGPGLRPLGLPIYFPITSFLAHGILGIDTTGLLLI